MIEPSSLETVARIHFKLRDGNVGLDRVSVSMDGAKLYVDGPIPSDPRGCCVLYSVDLKSLQTSIVASVFGGASRQQFVFSDGLVFPVSSIFAGGSIKEMNDSLLHLSPDGHWLFGVRSYPTPALEVFDRTREAFVREMTPAGSASDGGVSGTWDGDHFYLYAGSKSGRSRIWKVWPETEQLGAGLVVEKLGQIPGCASNSDKDIVAAGKKVFLYERFRFIGDRRVTCNAPVPGGVWIIDLASGRPKKRIASAAHFSALIADERRSFLYGWASEGRYGDGPARLLKIDARNGHVVKSRVVESGFLRMAIAPVRFVPTGDVNVWSNSAQRNSNYPSGSSANSGYGLGYPELKSEDIKLLCNA